MVSYYSDKLQGKKTASGEPYDKYKFTAAHRTLPFGTLLKVTNERDDLSVVVRVNDRGPYSHSRLIDVSKAAAQQINLIRYGVMNVRVEVIENESEDDVFPLDTTESELIPDSIFKVHDSIVKSDDKKVAKRRLSK